MIDVIQGGIAKDLRGQIRFVNDFDMNLVKRFYLITNADTKLIRGWRAHKIEQRWFYVIKGAFELNLVKIDYWEAPSRDLMVEKIQLISVEQKLFHIPAGYATAFKCLEAESEMLVFADYGIDHAKNDDYTYSLDYFENI